MNDERLVTTAWLAGRALELDEEELRGSVRRALLLLAAGGDPKRELELDSRAVTALAAELDAPERRAAFTAAVGELRDGAAALAADPERAWRAFACGLLAEALGEG